MARMRYLSKGLHSSFWAYCLVETPSHRVVELILHISLEVTTYNISNLLQAGWPLVNAAIHAVLRTVSTSPHTRITSILFPWLLRVAEVVRQVWISAGTRVPFVLPSVFLKDAGALIINFELSPRDVGMAEEWWPREIWPSLRTGEGTSKAE